MYGARPSLIIGFLAATLSTIVGVTMGLIAGYLGGGHRKVITWLIDFLLSLPFLLFASRWSPSPRPGSARSVACRRSRRPAIRFWVLITVLVVFGWLGLARLVRGEVLVAARARVRPGRPCDRCADPADPVQGAAAQPGRPDRRLDLARRAGVHRPPRPALSFLGVGPDRAHGRRGARRSRSAQNSFSAYPLYLWPPVIGGHLLVLALSLLGDCDPRRVRPQDPSVTALPLIAAAPRNPTDPQKVSNTCDGPQSLALRRLPRCGRRCLRRARVETAGSPERVPATGRPTQALGKDLTTDAKGPAARGPRCQEGRHADDLYSNVPSDTGPERAAYYVDSGRDPEAYFRALTQYVSTGPTTSRPGARPGHRPGQGVGRRLAWTFTLKDGLKYEDGTPVKAEDVAYAIKRSFAQGAARAARRTRTSSSRTATSTRARTSDGDAYAGVETRTTTTLVIHLAKPFPDMPYFVSFPMFTPIPQGEGHQAELRATSRWHRAVHVRRRTPRAPSSSWSRTPTGTRTPTRRATSTSTATTSSSACDTIKIQQAILASNGPDATTLNWDGNIDAHVRRPARPARRRPVRLGPVLRAPSVVNLDTRKMPLPVRKALAIAYPFDQARKAAGLTTMSAVPASHPDPAAGPGPPGLRRCPA